MSWDPADFAARLHHAASRFDRKAAADLCAELIEHVRGRDDPYPDVQAKQVLSTLRRKRFFDLMELVGDALIQSGQRTAVVRRLYAQSLIDRGNLTAAISVLEGLVRDALDDPAELAEARGLLGRVYKQIYVNARGGSVKHVRDALERALQEYHGVYASDPSNLWHGVNAVALMCRAASDGLSPKVSTDPKAMARDIIAAVQAKGNAAGYWDLATAGEACLALGDADQALAWIGKYVRADGVDAFELTSTHRQFVEVWRLTVEQDPGSLLLPILRERLLRKKDGGEVQLGARDLTGHVALLQRSREAGEFELVLGSAWFKNAEWYDLGRDRSRAVARIGKVGKRGLGTAFLVRGGDLLPALGEEPVLVTNAHVVTDSSEVKSRRGALFPQEVRATFEGLGAETAREVWKVAELIWTSPPEAYDTTVVRLDRQVPKVNPCPIRELEPVEAADAQVYVIGHPGGGEVAFSLSDNLLVGFKDPRLHYRAPTLGGSSGSPVFDDQWQLMAVHHAGFQETRLHPDEEVYAANEGIWIQAIRRAMARHFS